MKFARKSLVSKLIPMLLLIIIIFMSFSACASKKDNSPTDVTQNPKGSKESVETQKTPTKEPVVIEFWYPSGNDALNKYYDGLGEAFAKVNSDIKVNLVMVPAAASDVNTKLNAAKLSGTSPDALSAVLNLINTRAPIGAYEPLNKYIDNWADKDDIFTSALSVGKYKDDIVALGSNPAPELVVYRKDFFAEAGLDPEKPPKNWTELKEYAEKLTVKDDKGNIIRAGFDIPYDYSTTLEALQRMNGAVVVDEVNQVPRFDDPEVIEAYEFAANLAKKVSIPYSYSKPQDIPFLNGKSAMGVIAAALALDMYKNDPSMVDKIGYIPVLEQKKKSTFSGYRLSAITSDSKHKDEAWEFIKFIMSKEQMMKRAKDLLIPVVRNSLIEEFEKINPVLNSAIIEAVKYGKGAYNIPWGSIYAQHMSLAWEETIGGKKTAEKALKDAQQSAIEDLKKFELNKK